MQELVRIALVGTAKHAGASSVDADHPAETLVAKLAGDDREHVFLLRAGSRSVFEQCGQVARSDIVQQQPAPTEVRHSASQQLVRPLQNAFSSQSWELLSEFLRHLDTAGLLLPAELLPQALSVSDATVREHLQPVLGERGCWLSGFNAEWRWVTDGVGEISGRDRDALARQWDEGTVAERCRALLTMRRSAPAEAREWLAASIDKERADHRARLLKTLETGLLAADEPFLESRLDDRSEQVRRVAAGLLARLPDSGLARRMRERAEAILTIETTGRLRKKLKLACQPPENIDKTWERDGVPRRVPSGRGKRAVWAESILSAVPPSLWAQCFGCAPAKLIEAIRDDEFSQAALVGWTQAAGTFAANDMESAAWLEPLWDHWLTVEKRTRGEKGKRPVLARLQTLLKSMPTAEAALQPILKRSVTDAVSAELLGLLSLLPRPWSESFGLEYLTSVRAVLQRYADNRAYQWVGTLSIAGLALPRSTFDTALVPWEFAGTTTGSWHKNAAAREADKFREAIESRKHFYDEVAKTVE